MPQGASRPVATMPTTFGGVVSVVGSSLGDVVADVVADGVALSDGEPTTFASGPSLPSLLHAVSAPAVRTAALARATRRLMPEH
ncbi:hypothetical protein GCM10009795_009920 [Nocardioides hankookensis]